MDKIKTEIRLILENTRKKFNCDKITFASNRKYRYQFEVPHEYSKEIEEDDNYFVTVRLTHCKRFLCSELSNLTTSLVCEEVIYKARISPLIRDMFERFYQNREHWTAAVKCIGELDALCALAYTSSDSNMIRPIIHSMEQKPFLKIKQMRHPLLEKK